MVAELVSQSLWDHLPQVRDVASFPVRGGASSPRASDGQGQLSRALGLQHAWFTQATDINTDLSCFRTMDPHVALSNTLGPDVMMAPAAGWLSDTIMAPGGGPDTPTPSPGICVAPDGNRPHSHQHRPRHGLNLDVIMALGGRQR